MRLNNQVKLVLTYIPNGQVEDDSRIQQQYDSKSGETPVTTITVNLKMIRQISNIQGFENAVSQITDTIKNATDKHIQGLQTNCKLPDNIIAEKNTGDN